MALINFVREDNGVTAIEYGLIAALIAVVIISALAALGTDLKSNFQSISASISTTI